MYSKGSMKMSGTTTDRSIWIILLNRIRGFDFQFKYSNFILGCVLYGSRVNICKRKKKKTCAKWNSDSDNCNLEFRVLYPPKWHLSNFPPDIFKSIYPENYVYQ